MNIEKLETNIKDGMSYGYRQNLVLKTTYESFQSRIVEYLLTVNVAQYLLRWNQEFEGYNYRVNLEYPSIQFFNNAFLSYKEIVDSNLTSQEQFFAGREIIQRKHHIPHRNLGGKIDIAITQEHHLLYSSNSEKSLVGIEIKAINQYVPKIIEDIERLIFAMINTDPVSENSIKISYVTFLERLDRDNEVLSKAEIENRKHELDLKWKNELKNLLNQQNIQIIHELFTVEETAIETIEKRHQEMESSYDEVALETGVVVGVLIKLKVQ